MKTEVELYVYVNEAGAMLNRKEWRIFESPDFSDETQLVDAFIRYVQELIGAANAPDQ